MNWGKIANPAKVQKDMQDRLRNQAEKRRRNEKAIEDLHPYFDPHREKTRMFEIRQLLRSAARGKFEYSKFESYFDPHREKKSNIRNSKILSNIRKK